MSKDLVLVTGGTGSLGIACIIHALKAGYRVRTTVRRTSAIEEIKAAPIVHPYIKDLEIVLVEDITANDAFLEALQGVTYVIHVASPLPGQTGDFEQNTIQPAIRGTIGILTSALQVPTIARIVITSSIATVLGDDESKIYNETTLAPPPTPPYPTSSLAYRASKILTLHATKTFIATHHPTYTTINILPALMLGPFPLATTPAALTRPSASNGFLLSNILGSRFPAPLLACVVHVEDVAAVHMGALSCKEIGKEGGDFVVNAKVEGVVWDDALGIVGREFAEEVRSGVLPLGGTTVTKRCRVDGGKTEEVFGIRPKGFEEMVKGVVGQYLELLERTGGEEK